MQTASYVTQLRTALLAAAAPGGPETAQAAQLLAAAADPALQLVVLDLLGAVVVEVGAAVGVEVQVRLSGRDPEVVVISPTVAAPAEADEDMARITLRLPESLKDACERAAAGRHQSLNGYLVGAAQQAVGFPMHRAPSPGGHRLTGYARA